MVGYFEQKRRGSLRLASGDLTRASVCTNAIKACATEEEKTIISLPDSLDITVTKALLVLQDRFIGRVIDEYMKAGIPVPQDVANFKNLTVNTVNNRLTDVGKAIPGSKMRLLCHLPVGEIGQLPTRPEGTGPAKKKLRGSF